MGALLVPFDSLSTHFLLWELVPIYLFLDTIWSFLIKGKRVWCTYTSHLRHFLINSTSASPPGSAHWPQHGGQAVCWALGSPTGCSVRCAGWNPFQMLRGRRRGVTRPRTGSVFLGGQCAAGFPLGRTSDTLTAQRASLLQLILKDN